MWNAIAYRILFNRFAKLGDTFDEEWIERFEDMIVEEGEVFGTHSWNSGAPGAGAGPYEGLSEAGEAVGLLTVTEATERIWVDYKVNSNSGSYDGDDRMDSYTMRLSERLNKRTSKDFVRPKQIDT